MAEIYADIYAGLAIMGGLSVAAFLLGLRITRGIPPQTCDTLAASTVVVMIFYIRYIWDNVLLSVILPFSNLIVLGNWLPLAAGFMGSLAWRRTPGCTIRKAWPVAALGAAGGYSAILPFLGDVPVCSDRWEKGPVCYQTSNNTCAAACAAMLLRAHGIYATEQEMAALCFTREGTTWKGLYHGLKWKTEFSPYDVEVFQCDLKELREKVNGDGTEINPAILCVGFDEVSSDIKELGAEFGLSPGMHHSVLVYHFRHDKVVELFDPSPDYGRTRWAESDLELLWRGQGIRLVKR